MRHTKNSSTAHWTRNIELETFLVCLYRIKEIEPPKPPANFSPHLMPKNLSYPIFKLDLLFQTWKKSGRWPKLLASFVFKIDIEISISMQLLWWLIMRRGSEKYHSLWRQWAPILVQPKHGEYKNILLLLKQTNVMHFIGIVLHLNGFIQEQRMKHLIQNKVTALIYEIGIVYVLHYKQVRSPSCYCSVSTFGRCFSYI
jgi:hypothetical protein